MLSAMDDGIGKTLAALRDGGLEEDTLIIFFNDNGGPTMAGTTINGSSNAPLRGSKRQTFEGGIRVPFIIRWKGHLAEGKTDARPIIQLDVLPTALAAAGVKPQPRWKIRRRESAPVSHRKEVRPAARSAFLASRRKSGDTQRRLEAGEDQRTALCKPSTLPFTTIFRARNFTTWRTTSGKKRILPRYIPRRSRSWPPTGKGGTKNSRNPWFPAPL